MTIEDQNTPKPAAQDETKAKALEHIHAIAEDCAAIKPLVAEAFATLEAHKVSSGQVEEIDEALSLLREALEPLNSLMPSLRLVPPMGPPEVA